MAFLQSQLDIINSLVADATITAEEGLDLMSSPNGFTDAQKTFIDGLGLSTSDEEILLAENRSTQQQLEEEIAQAKQYLLAKNFNDCRMYLAAAEMTLASLTNYQLGNRKVEYSDRLRFITSNLDELESRVNTNANKNKRVFMRYTRE